MDVQLDPHVCASLILWEKAPLAAMMTAWTFLSQLKSAMRGSSKNLTEGHEVMQEVSKTPRGEADERRESAREDEDGQTC